MSRPFSRRSILRTTGLTVGAGLVGVSGGGSAAAVPNHDYETTTGKTEQRYSQAPAEQHYIETKYTLPAAKGGATESPTMFGEIIWPQDEKGNKIRDVPVILTYSPYNDIRSPQSEAASVAAGATADYFVPRGYARAVFDVVGCRNSGGCYDYGGYRERVTGREVIEYLGGEPDAAGNYVDWDGGSAGTRPVGMIGASYDGTTQLAAAVEDPKHLAAIVPQVAIDRWYDYAFGGGIRYFLNNQYPTDEGFDTPLAFDLGFGFVPPLNVDDPSRFAGAMERRFAGCDALQHTDRAYEYDPVYDAFWDRRDYRQRATGYVPEEGTDAYRDEYDPDSGEPIRGVNCAVYIEGGWLDHNVKHWDSTRFFDALPDDVPKKLAIGQWNHSASEFADARDIRHAWFDRFLKGIDTGVTDLPRVDTQTSTGERLQHEAMPPRGTRTLSFALTRADADQTSLALQGSGAPVYTDATPITEEEMFVSEDSGERHLKFESAPLDRELRIAGSVPLSEWRAPQLDLLAASTMASTHFTPVLYERFPDGSTQVTTRGFLNARKRNGLDKDEPVPVGEPYRAPTELWDTDYTFTKGSRLGLVVASDNRDWCLDDPDGHATNEIILGAPGGGGGTTLRLPVTKPPGDLRTPDATGTRTDDGRVFTAGQTNQIDVTVEASRGSLAVRDRLPADWSVAGGDVARTESLESGETLVYLAGQGRRVEGTYFAEAPDATGRYTFGPVEASYDGDHWISVPGTGDTNTVVGVDTNP